MPESSTAASTTHLTPEQLDRIATNKAQALTRLRAKRTANEQQKTEPPKKAKWIKSFYEYDLSTLENSKGGFIVEEQAFDEKRNKERSYVIEPYYRKF
jgi:DNA-repair protein complementing XP-A cells